MAASRCLDALPGHLSSGAASQARIVSLFDEARSLEQHERAAASSAIALAPFSILRSHPDKALLTANELCRLPHIWPYEQK